MYMYYVWGKLFNCPVNIAYSNITPSEYIYIMNPEINNRQNLNVRITREFRFNSTTISINTSTLSLGSFSNLKNSDSLFHFVEIYFLTLLLILQF